MYVYVYIYIYIYMHICVYIYIYIYIHTGRISYVLCCSISYSRCFRSLRTLLQLQRPHVAGLLVQEDAEAKLQRAGKLLSMIKVYCFSMLDCMYHNYNKQY